MRVDIYRQNGTNRSEEDKIIDPSYEALSEFCRDFLRGGYKK